jgi:hypothetical protein
MSFTSSRLEAVTLGLVAQCLNHLTTTLIGSEITELWLYSLLGWPASNEIGKVWRKAPMSQSEVLSQYLLGETEENREKPANLADLKKQEITCWSSIEEEEEDEKGRRRRGRDHITSLAEVGMTGCGVDDRGVGVRILVLSTIFTSLCSADRL